jgi:CubicO group peptidase (beta-lactamase class C family)
MTGGFPDQWDYATVDFPVGDVDWVEWSLAHQERAPGEVFAYSNLGSHLVSAVLVQATGRTVLDYAREKLFDPLGIPTTPATELVAAAESEPAFVAADFVWLTDPRGTHIGAGYLKLRPEDLVRFGRLFLADGVWEGRQVVPAQWVRDATTAHVDSRNSRGGAPGYGYLWWVGSADGAPSFSGIGSGGQRVEVVPSRDLVVVVTSDENVAEDAIVYAPDTHRLVADFVAPLFAP